MFDIKEFRSQIQPWFKKNYGFVVSKVSVMGKSPETWKVEFSHWISDNVPFKKKFAKFLQKGGGVGKTENAIALFPEQWRELLGITEDNVTGGGEVVNTPFAFTKTGKPGERKSKHHNPYKLEMNTPNTTPQSTRVKALVEQVVAKLKVERPDIIEQLLKEISYQEFAKDDTMSPKQKISSAVLEIKKNMRVIEQTVVHAQKLKLESGVSAEEYWKPSRAAFAKISERMNRVARSLRELGS